MPKVAMVYQRVVMINTAKTGVEKVWARIGKGMTSVSPDNAPNVDTKIYIDESAPNSEVTSYSRSIALSGDLVRDDAAQTALLSYEGKTGSDAHADVLVYDQDPALEKTAYKARMYDATVVINSAGGGDGGGIQQVDITLQLNGAPVVGTYNETTATFAEPVA
jgi:hypothetical protein